MAIKRIVIIFIIVFCLLSFIEISFLAEEPMSHGEIWNAFNEVEKEIYIGGFGNGIEECLNKLVPLIKDKDIGLTSIFLLIALDELYDLYDFIWEHRKNIRVVIAVMDDLYRDPANTYIRCPSMFKIAYQKLKGEDI